MLLRVFTAVGSAAKPVDPCNVCTASLSVQRPTHVNTHYSTHSLATSSVYCYAMQRYVADDAAVKGMHHRSW
jgi:hypothetical protein